MSTPSYSNKEHLEHIEAPVASVVSNFNLEAKLQVFAASAAVAVEAAIALSIDLAQIGKSIAFRADDFTAAILILGALRADKFKLRCVTA